MTNARPLGDIAIELKTLRRNNVIRSGELLFEAQAQQEYGDFLQWVEGVNPSASFSARPSEQ
jgi:hypothetical protein